MGISGIPILTVFSLQNSFSARLRVLKTRSAMVHSLRIRSLEGKIGLSWCLGEWNSKVNGRMVFQHVTSKLGPVWVGGDPTISILTPSFFFLPDRTMPSPLTTTRAAPGTFLKNPEKKGIPEVGYFTPYPPPKKKQLPKQV